MFHSITKTCFAQPSPLEQESWLAMFFVIGEVCRIKSLEFWQKD